MIQSVESKMMSETKVEARKKWREYISARKKSRNKIYGDLARVYNQLKRGRKVIDIQKVIAAGGIDSVTHLPRLAIACADQHVAYCYYEKNGNVRYTDIRDRHSRSKRTVNAKLPLWTGDRNEWNVLEAPLPLIPPAILPPNLTDDYYVLWEVEEWKQTPPSDPYLLRRLSPNMFVVLAAWDLTELERSAISGRMS